MKKVLCIAGLFFLWTSSEASRPDLVPVSNRFEKLALELRRHRAQMLPLIDKESSKFSSELSLGQEALRIYLKWDAPAHIKLKSLDLTWYDASDTSYRQTVLVKDSKSDWVLNWYQVLIPKPQNAHGRVQLSFQYEGERKNSLFASNRLVLEDKASLPIVIDSQKNLILSLRPSRINGAQLLQVPLETLRAEGVLQ